MDVGSSRRRTGCTGCTFWRGTGSKGKRARGLWRQLRVLSSASSSSPRKPSQQNRLLLPPTRVSRLLPPVNPTDRSSSIAAHPSRESRPRLPSSTTQFDLRALERYLAEPALNLYAPLLLGKGLHSIVAVRAIVGSWFEGLLENLAEVDGQGREMMPLGMRMVLNGVLLRKAKEQQ